MNYQTPQSEHDRYNPCAGWCFHRRHDRVSEQTRARIDWTLSRRGCWLELATAGASGGPGKADGDVAWPSGVREPWGEEARLRRFQGKERRFLLRAPPPSVTRTARS